MEGSRKNENAIIRFKIDGHKKFYEGPNSKSQYGAYFNTGPFAITTYAVFHNNKLYQPDFGSIDYALKKPIVRTKREIKGYEEFENLDRLYEVGYKCRRPTTTTKKYVDTGEPRPSKCHINKWDDLMRLQNKLKRGTVLEHTWVNKNKNNEIIKYRTNHYFHRIDNNSKTKRLYYKQRINMQPTSTRKIGIDRSDMSYIFGNKNSCWNVKGVSYPDKASADAASGL